jgi:hypothetical protein
MVLSLSVCFSLTGETHFRRRTDRTSYRFLWERGEWKTDIKSERWAKPSQEKDGPTITKPEKWAKAYQKQKRTTLSSKLQSM